MSDLAAPLLAVLQDEADGFWCFAALMERLQANFDTDCSCAPWHPPLAVVNIRIFGSSLGILGCKRSQPATA